MRTATALRNGGEDLSTLATETVPERLDVIVACLVTMTVIIAVTGLVVVAKMGMTSRA